MHTLVVLTVVLAASSPTAAPASWQAPAVDVLMSSPRELIPSKDLLASRYDRRHLLNTTWDRQGEADAVISRVLLEFAAGFGLGVGGVTLGGAVIAANGGGPSGLVILPLSLLMLGNSLGVTLAGAAMDQRGRFGPTLLGSAIGFAVPLIVGSAILAQTSNNECSASSPNRCGGWVAISIGMLVLPTIGAMIGYEVSLPSLVRAPPPSPGYLSSRPASPRIVPTLALTRQGIGATLGLAGTL